MSNARNVFESISHSHVVSKYGINTTLGRHLSQEICIYPYSAHFFFIKFDYNVLFFYIENENFENKKWRYSILKGVILF